MSGGSVRGGDIYRSRGDVDSFITMLIVFGSAAVIISAISSCFRNRRSTPLMAQQSVELQVAKPVMPGQAMVAGTPCAMAHPAMPAGYPQAYPAGYPHHGYSGGNVAMGAGMGFLGGMMVGEMMSDVGHHGGYGGDYGGGGGDFGGGDGGFAADM